MALARESPSREVAAPGAESPKGSRIAAAILRLIGWQIAGRLPDQPRYVLIVAPHTSNWDFPVGVVAKFTLGLEATWLGKHTLFRFPVNGLLRWLGGEPIDRNTRHGTTHDAIQRFRERTRWILVISPEGTRKRVAEWKTGFQRIAHGAGVPIVPVSFDWSTRTITLMDPVWTTADCEADVRALRGRFHAGMARWPEGFGG